MGHMLKNTVFKNGSYSLGVPAQTTVLRPAPAVSGQTRFNTSTNRLEFYNGTTWQSIAHEGTAVITVDSFSGDGTNQNFGPMSFGGSENWEANVLVHVGTVYQIPGTNYTFSGTGNTTIHFTSIPNNGAAITIIHGLNSTTAA